ncbi:unnamed protein product [Hymenolepis diminuta]|uniref:Uncharacterized protein n=1 Tax=Hymenolepis diminuta TaxID=6216 RepID=A0A564ZAS6_HYMDI|nr:unnamed protein product [Hymenolepis diminuta]
MAFCNTGKLKEDISKAIVQSYPTYIYQYPSDSRDGSVKICKFQLYTLYCHLNRSVKHRIAKTQNETEMFKFSFFSTM